MTRQLLTKSCLGAMLMAAVLDAQPARADHAATVLADGGAPYYRLGEAGGAIAADASPLHLDGSYSGTGVTFGRPSLVGEPNDASIRVNGAEGGCEGEPNNIIAFVDQVGFTPALRAKPFV